MKPKNFPERVNARRKRALSYLAPVDLLTAGNLEEKEILKDLIRPSRRRERSKKPSLDINGIPARYRKPRGLKP